MTINTYTIKNTGAAFVAIDKTGTIVYSAPRVGDVIQWAQAQDGKRFLA